MTAAATIPWTPAQLDHLETFIEAATDPGIGETHVETWVPDFHALDPFAGQTMDREMTRMRTDWFEQRCWWRWRESNPDAPEPSDKDWLAIKATMAEPAPEGWAALLARRKAKDAADDAKLLADQKMAAELVDSDQRLATRGVIISDEAEDTAMKKKQATQDETVIDLDAARDGQRPPSLRLMFDITQDVGAELSWQADGLTPHGGIMLFAGGKSAGKSTLARTYALAVARGDPFLGREVEQGPVVVASLEDPKGVSSEHWHQLGLREDDSVFGWDGQLPEDPASWLHDVYQKVRPALVLIDSFGRWTRGKASLNSYDEIIAITEDVLAFCRATHCVVAFTHHIRKGGGEDVSETVSGSMALIGLMDTTLHLLRNGDGTRSIQTTQRAA